MKEYSQKFCDLTGINFVRIDFYEVNGEVYFGEYTFVPNLCVHKLNTQYEKYLIEKYHTIEKRVRKFIKEIKILRS